MIAIANTPSLNASTRPVPQRFPTTIWFADNWVAPVLPMLVYVLRDQALPSFAVRCSTDGFHVRRSYRGRMSRVGAAGLLGRVGAVQGWLSGRGDQRAGRLAILWFRRYFEASHNSGSAATLYSFLSVVPFVLAVIGLTHAGGAMPTASPSG